MADKKTCADTSAHLDEITLLKRYHFDRAAWWRAQHSDSSFSGALAEANTAFHLQRVANLCGVELALKNLSAQLPGGAA